MTAQSLPLRYQEKNNKDSLALIFFLIGAPHIYSFFKKKKKQKAKTRTLSFRQTAFGLMGCGLIGAASPYVF